MHREDARLFLVYYFHTTTKKPTPDGAGLLFRGNSRDALLRAQVIFFRAKVYHRHVNSKFISVP